MKPFLRQSGPPLTDGRVPRAFMHPCWKDGCTAWGSFGYGVALLRGKPGTWACRDHRAELEAALAGVNASATPAGDTAPVPEPESRDEPETAGDLFGHSG